MLGVGIVGFAQLADGSSTTVISSDDGRQPRLAIRLQAGQGSKPRRCNICSRKGYRGSLMPATSVEELCRSDVRRLLGRPLAYWAESVRQHHLHGHEAPALGALLQPRVELARLADREPHLADAPLHPRDPWIEGVIGSSRPFGNHCHAFRGGWWRGSLGSAQPTDPLTTLGITRRDRRSPLTGKEDGLATELENSTLSRNPIEPRIRRRKAPIQECCNK